MSVPTMLPDCKDLPHNAATTACTGVSMWVLQHRPSLPGTKKAFCKADCVILRPCNTTPLGGPYRRTQS